MFNDNWNTNPNITQTEADGLVEFSYWIKEAAKKIIALQDLEKYLYSRTYENPRSSFYQKCPSERFEALSKVIDRCFNMNTLLSVLKSAQRDYDEERDKYFNELKSGSKEIKNKIDITVEFEFMPEIQATCEIKPLTRPDGTPDLRALDLYDEFIVNALSVFDYHDFEILEEHQSPSSYSYYFTLVKKDDAKNKEYKYILFIRLSDHTNRSESEKARKVFYAKEADRLKEPQTKTKQIWRLKEIVINNETYFSYEDALEDIDKRLN